MKIAINRCYGGFDLSYEGWKMYVEKKYPNSTLEVTIPEFLTKGSNYTKSYFIENGYANYNVNGESLYSFELERTDPILIEVIETLGEKANSKVANLKVVEIPDDVKYEISEYDGLETVEEIHRTWC